MNLYKLEQKWEDLNNQIELLQYKTRNSENPEEDFELYNLGANIKENFDNFVNNAPIEIVKNIKNKEAEIEARKNEIKRLQDMNKSAESIIDYSKNFLSIFMDKTGLQNITTDIGKISLRDGAYKVEIIDENLVPKEYLRIKQEVNKSELQKLFKNSLNTTGELLEIPGIKYVKGEKTISIK